MPLQVLMLSRRWSNADKPTCGRRRRPRHETLVTIPPGSRMLSEAMAQSVEKVIDGNLQDWIVEAVSCQ